MLTGFIFSHRFAKAPDAAQMNWSTFTKGYFLNRETLVGVLLLIDESVPPQKIDLDCANWLGRNNVSYLSIPVYSISESTYFAYPQFINLSSILIHTSPFLASLLCTDTNDFRFYKVRQDEG